MKVSGYHDEEGKKIFIEIEYDQTAEFSIFDRYFKNMMDQMMRENGGAMVNLGNGEVVGDVEANQEEIEKLLFDLAKESAVQMNSNIKDKFKNNFC